MSDEPSKTPRAEDASYVTIPPELRDFVPPKGAPKAEKNPQLVATVAALKALNGGGEQADPFFFNTQGVATAVERSEGAGAEGDEAKGAGNAKVHVPAFALPSAASAAVMSAAASEDAEITVKKAPAVAVETVPAVETEVSPWAAEPAVAKIAVGDLPSALAPVARTESAPASVKAAGAPMEQEGRLLRVGLSLVIVVVLGFAAFQLVPKWKTTEQVGAVPVVSAAASSAGAVVPQPEVSARAPRDLEPVKAVEIDAGASAVPSAAGTPVPVKVKSSGGAEENIYDAAPSPVRSVEVPLPSATVPVAPPAKTVELVPQSPASSGFYFRKKPQ